MDIHDNTPAPSGQDQQDPPELAELKKFLAAILPAAGTKCGFVLGSKRHFFWAGIDQFARAILTHDGLLGSFAVYHACAVFKKHGSRKKENVLGAQCLWLDVDAGKDKPHRDQSAAIDAVKSFCERTGLPEPILVDSGYGIHVYWPLDRMLEREEWEAAAKRLKSLCDAHGLKADHSRTTDITSMLRPPGTYNRKNPNAHRVVKLLSPLVGRYNTNEILEKLGCELPAKETMSVPIKTSAERIADQCAQIARLRDTQGNVSEPEWYACFCVLAKCNDGMK
jgi:hypothetical protein